MGRYGNADYGLIIKPKHIVCASYRDTYTLNTRDDEENLFNIRPPLMLPQEVEDTCMQQPIEENGEMLNYETTSIYSEQVSDLNNRNKFKKHKQQICGKIDFKIGIVQ